MNRLLPIAAALMCLVAMLPGMPYGYFMLLRWVVCCALIVCAVQLHEKRAEPWKWACVALAVLFNPLIKIHLGREVWWWVDGAASVFLLAAAYRLRVTTK